MRQRSRRVLRRPIPASKRPAVAFDRQGGLVALGDIQFPQAPAARLGGIGPGGKKLRRLSLRAFADAQVVGREFEAMNVLLMRHKRRAASRHALLALFAVIIWGEDVTAAGKETGLP